VGETPSLDVGVEDSEVAYQLDGVRSVARLSDERIRGWFRRPRRAERTSPSRPVWRRGIEQAYSACEGIAFVTARI
jgi:hypothetical protein